MQFGSVRFGAVRFGAVRRAEGRRAGAAVRHRPAWPRRGPAGPLGGSAPWCPSGLAAPPPSRPGRAPGPLGPWGGSGRGAPPAPSVPGRAGGWVPSTWPAGLGQAGRRKPLESKSPGKPSLRDKWHRSLVTETQHPFSSGQE